MALYSFIQCHLFIILIVIIEKIVRSLFTLKPKLFHTCKLLLWKCLRLDGSLVQITILHSTFPHVHAGVIFSLYTSDGVVIKLESGLSLQLIGVSSTEGEWEYAFLKQTWIIKASLSPSLILSLRLVMQYECRSNNYSSRGGTLIRSALLCI